MFEDNSPLTDLTEVGAELVEPVFDRLLASQILNDFPVLSSAVRIALSVGAIRDRIFATKVQRFLFALGDIDETKVNEMLWALRKDRELRDKVGATVLVVLDRLDDLDKARMIGKAFGAYLRKRIDFAQFRPICLVVNSSFLDDLEAFVGLPSPEASIPDELQRSLMVPGIYESSRTAMDVGGFSAISVGISSLGKLFHQTMRES